MRASISLNHSDLTLDELVRRELTPLAGQAVLVVGDLILDRYLWGSVERTTPEAPVAVVRHERSTCIIGGAANVAHNICALGGRAEIVGVVGDDADGETVRGNLAEARIGAAGAIVVRGRPTTVKTRVVSMGQQLLRIDNEDTSPLGAEIIERLCKAIERLARSCRAILLSDYLKGVLAPKVIAAAIKAARKHSIPLLVDPKGHDYARYCGADILTPNRRELSQAVGKPVGSEDELREAGRALLRRCDLQALAITLSEEGMMIIPRRGKPVRLPAQAPEVFDPTGAGDSTIAAMALGLASGMDLTGAARLGNQAGGIVCAKLGVATVSPAEMLAAFNRNVSAGKVRQLDELKILLPNLQTVGRKVVFTNGCFDLLHPGHIQFLHEAKKLGDLLVVGLNTDQSVRAVKGPGRPILGQYERAAILSALEIVDYITFFDELTPESLLKELHPDVLVKGRNVPENEVVGREIVESYGGKVVRLPMLYTSTSTQRVDTLAGTLKKARKTRA